MTTVCLHTIKKVFLLIVIIEQVTAKLSQCDGIILQPEQPDAIYQDVEEKSRKGCNISTNVCSSEISDYIR